jgi:hypothetical protein
MVKPAPEPSMSVPAEFFRSVAVQGAKDIVQVIVGEAEQHLPLGSITFYTGTRSYFYASRTGNLGPPSSNR